MKATTRGALEGWLDALAKRYTLIAPRSVEGELLYRPVRSSDEVVFDFERTVLSPKSFFLPDTDVLLEVEIRDGQVSLYEPSPEREQVIFGVRPCDAQGLRALDALLLDRPPPDSVYAERREKTTLIGLACPRLWDDCFCTSLGSAPDDASAVDVMLYVEDASQGTYLVQEVTPRGAELLDLLDAEETDRQPPASDTLGEEVPILPAEAWRALFEEPYWQRLADRCLACHACTYVCPTCRCFDVRDDTTAAGPGVAHIQRLRNRYYCKFCYAPVDFGAVACVGCGRCIAVCPVGIDIAEMLADVAKLAGGTHE